MPANLENSVVASGLEKSVFIPILKTDNPNESSNHRTIALISHTCNVMLQILHSRLQQYVNCKLTEMFKLYLENTEESEIKLPTSVGSSKKQESSTKTSAFAY